MGERGWMKGSDAEVQAHLVRAMAQVRGARPHTVLGVTLAASAEGVRAAFLDHTKTFHPTRYARRSPEVQKLANELFLAIKAAYDELKDGVPTTSTSPSPAPERSAPTPMAASPAPVPAAPAPSKATQPVDSDPRFRNAAVLIDRQEYAQARAELAALLSEYPGSARLRAHYHYAAGGEYLAGGRERLALSELKRALGADPGFEPARRAVAKLAAGRLGWNGK